MPLIIKSLSVDAASFAELSDDENDFIRDPEKVRDQLPMPFRMIDKVLSNLIDDAWTLTVEREKERIAERSKVRPPKYECGINLSALKNVTGLCESADGRYVFVLFRGGIHILDAASRRLVSTWEEENIEITQAQCVVMGAQTYLMSTVDVSGTARLLVCTRDRIHLARSMTEEQAAKHVTALRYEVSREGDFAGLLLENIHTKESWLEVYQLPRDVWIKELEAANVREVAAAGTGVQTAATDGSVEKTSVAAAVQSQSSELASSTNDTNVGDPAGLVFTPPTMILRVKPPAKFTPNPLSSASQAFKEVSDNKVILLGTGTLLTRAYSEIRKDMFQEANAEILSCLPSPTLSDRPSLEATVHFLSPGLVLPYGIEQPGAINRPTSVAVWWTGSNLLFMYCLIRPPKAKKSNEVSDTEFDLRPEAVWPQAAPISASCTTDCSSLLALGLKNGAVVVWDKQLGIMRKSVIVSTHPVTKLQFLSPSICSQSNNDKRYYPTSTSFHVLASCSDGSIHTLNCGLMDHAEPICIRTSAQTDDENVSHLKVLTGIPELVLIVQKDGSIFLLDVTTSSVLCEIAMPQTHALASPWQPVMALAAFGQVLYAKGQRIATKNSKGASQQSAGATENDEAAPIFAFQLRSFPSLDKYWKRKRPDVAYTTCSTIDVRVAALLTHRVKSSAARKQRLEQRWPQMKQELSRIAALKQVH